MRKRNKKTDFQLIENVHVIEGGAEGKAVAKVDGQVIFIPFVAPGDVVDVQITARKKQYLEGKAVRLVEPSPLRTEPMCSHFTLCGGCRWQHLNYATQLALKQKQVEDAFARIGKFSFPPLQPILGSEQTYFYRNKLEFTFSARKWFTQPPEEGRFDDPRALGFHLPGMFDRVLHLDNCFLQADPSNAIRSFIHQTASELGLTYYDPKRHEGLLRNLIIRTSTIGQTMVILVSKSDESLLRTALFPAIIRKFPQLSSLIWIINPHISETLTGLPLQVMHGEPWLTEQMPGPKSGDLPLHFRIAPASFFQTNPKQAAVLYRTAFAFAQLKGNETVYDLYSGTGTISCLVARHCQKVVGVEYVQEAVSDARLNAKLNGLDNIDFVAGDLGKMFDQNFVAHYGRPDVVITDPPRAGMHPKVVEQLLQLLPARIVYVSCNPATQARDIAMLSEKYDVTAVQPVDMFPQTHHVENVASLVIRQ